MLALEVTIHLRDIVSLQWNHGKISMRNIRRFPSWQHTQFDAHVNHLQIHRRPHPLATPQVVWACASESLPLCCSPDCLSSTHTVPQETERSVIHTPRCLPTTPSTCEKIILQTVTTFASTHKLHSPPAGPAQVNKMLQMLSVLHHSPECQNTNYNHEIEWHTIMERGCFFNKGSRSYYAGQSKGPIFMGTKFNAMNFCFRVTPHFWGRWCSLAEVRLSNSNLYTSVEYH